MDQDRAQPTVCEADLSNPVHADAVVELTEMYAHDRFGNGGPLPDSVLLELVPQLRRHPATVIFLSHIDDRPVGLATCFLGFSTFRARPVINIHDLAVSPGYRGRGIAKLLLAAVEAKAVELGCAKVTLEVVETNSRARGVYEAAGFSHAGADTPVGGALFYAKSLSTHGSA